MADWFRPVAARNWRTWANRGSPELVRIDEERLPKRSGHPAATQIIAHADAEENQQPEESSHCDDPRQPAAPTNVHEEQDDERRLRAGDGQHHDIVQGPHVDLGGPDSEERSDDQRTKNHVVHVLRCDVVRNCHYPSLTPRSGRRSSRAAGTGRSTRYRRSASRVLQPLPACSNRSQTAASTPSSR